MSKYLDALVSKENLSWAWRKAKRLYRMADGPYNIAELAAFELDLERQLESIADDFRSNRYFLNPLVLLPQPKKSDLDGRPRLRQSFHVAVRDQVAWIAIVNVIGPELDSKMPPWSYGHRLYKAAWFEEREGVSRLEIGPYRHSNGQLYRRFKHSWPLFRRHISLTARAMANGLRDREQLDAAEKSALNFPERPVYLNEEYWPKGGGPTLYYASLDLEKFYPRVATASILEGISRHLSDFDADPRLRKLLERMLSFRVTRARSKYLNDPICEPRTRSGSFAGIPTGLMVAGFLSNVAMLPLDILTDRRVNKARDVAHFRFVDDHVIISYQFEHLVAWIAKYERALDRLKIGPRISSKKYDPPKMDRVVGRKASLKETAEVKSSCLVDGARPSRLMTKTLTLVSELAGVGFDILPERAQLQRLGEVEWLLLANLPEDEIRADTRAAFAAGRISALVPRSFSPSVELLEGHRRLSQLQAQGNASSEDISAAKSQVNSLRTAQAKADLRRLDHYFKLLMQAYQDHPDKPRLFIRVLDYCRATGQRGTPAILRWLEGQSSDAKQRPLAEYCQTLALQIIARHAVTASLDISDMRLLARQRRAARSYLISLTGHRARQLFHSMVSVDRQDLAGVSARNCLMAALACSKAIVRHRGLKGKLEKLTRVLDVPDLISSSSEWLRITGSPIGVWSHWLDGLKPPRDGRPGRTWRLTRTNHNPRNVFDLANLRKGPRLFTKEASTFLSANPDRLMDSDEGWLLDVQRSRFPLPLERLQQTSNAARRLYEHIAEHSGSVERLSLLDWVTELAKLSPYDPRASEWTALEVIRQLALAVQLFPSGRLDQLDKLHPSNITVPIEWLRPRPPDALSLSTWTWESWRQIVRGDAPRVKIVKAPIADFRRQSNLQDASDPEYRWLDRLRAIGLLLLGLCSKKFVLPAEWNVRGIERDVGFFVKTSLEDITISSRTQGILQATLLARSVETALIRISPWMFFGARQNVVINDTSADPPLIVDLQALLEEITGAQSVLESKQISVLNHAARQLVPMNVFQLMHVAVPIGDEEDDVGFL